MKIDETLDAENKDDYDGNLEQDGNEEDESVEDNILVNDLVKEENCSENEASTNKFPLLKFIKLFTVLKYSEQWRNKLKSCCEITDEKMHFPNIDISTRRSSTYPMIDTAIKIQRALTLLCKSNEPLQKFFISAQE